MIAYDEGLPVDPSLTEFAPAVPSKDLLGADQVYLINLDRRPDRRRRMEASFDVLGVSAVRTPAVDGKAVADDAFLDAHGIRMMPDFVEPYHDRRYLTRGEVGCFLSHYNVWRDVLDKGYDQVIVFEDDIRFEPFFRAKVRRFAPF